MEASSFIVINIINVSDDHVVEGYVSDDGDEFIA
jgi:hypothetical protein